MQNYLCFYIVLRCTFRHLSTFESCTVTITTLLHMYVEIPIMHSCIHRQTTFKDEKAPQGLTMSPGSLVLYRRLHPDGLQLPAACAARINTPQEAVLAGSFTPACAKSHCTNIMHHGFPSRPNHLPYLVLLLPCGLSVYPSSPRAIFRTSLTRAKALYLPRFFARPLHYYPPSPRPFACPLRPFSHPPRQSSLRPRLMMACREPVGYMGKRRHADIGTFDMENRKMFYS